MSDPWLAPRFPLDDVSLPSGPAFALAETPPSQRFVFRGGEAARAACSAAFGAELPTKLGQAGEGDERAALWLGPDEWLLIAEGEDPDLLAADIEDRLGAIPHSLVDVAHRQIGLLVSGAAAARALSAGCPLDLRSVRPSPSAPRRAPSSTRRRSCCGVAARRRSKSKSDAPSRPISSQR